MAYQAMIARVKVRPHPNADRLQLGTVLGSQVVIGLDTQDNELGVFFPCDGVLCYEHLVANDLLPRFDEKTGKRIGGGYFDPKGRVRAQKFRGEKSEGFFAPLSTLKWTGVKIEKLKEGDAFEELNGKKVCEKWINPATLQARQKQNPRVIIKENPLFLEHVDTRQFRYEVDNIPDGSIIYISEKLHGTSHRLAHILDEKPFPKWIAPIAKLLHIKPKKVYRHLNGSRRVNLEYRKGISFYGTDEFRFNLTRDIQLHKDETIYGEIVGYVGQDQPIMAQPIEDKDLQKKYGNRMIYKYGCPIGTSALFIYRITRINPDGKIVDLSWYQMVNRCNELRLHHVPPIFGPVIYYKDEMDKLKDTVELLAEGDSCLDPSHIKEGVVIRVETPKGDTYWLKNKQFIFKVLEGIAKEKEIVDMEEAQDVTATS
jgi:hypothetical protein